MELILFSFRIFSGFVGRFFPNPIGFISSYDPGSNISTDAIIDGSASTSPTTGFYCIKRVAILPGVWSPLRRPFDCVDQRGFTCLLVDLACELAPVVTIYNSSISATVAVISSAS